jgi:hypothetical protein
MLSPYLGSGYAATRFHQLLGGVERWAEDQSDRLQAV